VLLHALQLNRRTVFKSEFILMLGYFSDAYLTFELKHEFELDV